MVLELFVFYFKSCFFRFFYIIVFSEVFGETLWGLPVTRCFPQFKASQWRKSSRFTSIWWWRAWPIAAAQAKHVDEQKINENTEKWCYENRYEKLQKPPGGKDKLWTHRFTVFWGTNAESPHRVPDVGSGNSKALYLFICSKRYCWSFWSNEWFSREELMSFSFLSFEISTKWTGDSADFQSQGPGSCGSSCFGCFLLPKESFKKNRMSSLCFELL